MKPIEFKTRSSIAIIDLDPNRLLEGLNNNFFRKWAFEVTEPHILVIIILI